MKTKLLLLCVIGVFCTTILAQPTQRNSWKRHRTKMPQQTNSPTRTVENDYNVKASTRMVEPWQGKQVPKQATRKNVPVEGITFMPNEEYYEYDEYGNVTLEEPNSSERIIYQYDPKSKGKLLLSVTHYLWDYQKGAWIKKPHREDMTTTLDANGIRTGISQAKLSELTFNEKGYITHAKLIYYDYESEESELTCVWKGDFPEKLIFSYHYDSEMSTTTLTDIQPKAGLENFNPYTTDIEAWEDILYNDENSSVYFDCEGTLEEIYKNGTQTTNIRMRCIINEAQKEYQRAIYMVRNGNEILMNRETTKKLDEYGSYHYISEEVEDSWTGEIVVTINEHGDIIRREEIEQEGTENRYSYIETYERTYEGGKLVKTLYKNITNEQVREMWEETYDKRPEPDRSIISLTISSPGTLGNLLKELSKPPLALKLDGELNYSDFAILQEHYNLGYLDIGKITNSIFPSDYLYNMRNLSGIILPDSVKEIENGTLNQECLAFIKWPPKLERISGNSFNYLRIDSLQLPASVKYIGYSTFNECHELQYAEIPASLTQFPQNAFNECYQLKKIVCPSIAPLLPERMDDLFLRGVSRSLCTIVVPDIGLPSYKYNKYWNTFQKFETMNMEMYDWVLNGHLLLTDEFSPTTDQDIELNLAGGLIIDRSAPLQLGTLRIHQGETFDGWGNIIEAKQFPIVLPKRSTMSANNIELVYACYPDKWYFISFPFDVKTDEIEVSEGVDFAIRRYDGQARGQFGPTRAWVNVKKGETLNAGQGHIIQFSATVNYFKLKAVKNINFNKFFKTDASEIPIQDYPSEYAHNRSWNFVGNPYPCFYDIQQMDYEAPITVWNGRGYNTYSPLDDDFVLAPMQAFFVQKAPNAGTIQLPANGRREDSYYSFYGERNTRSALSDTERQVFNLELENKTYTDRTRIVLAPRQTSGYDIGRDALKFISENEKVQQLFTLDDAGIQYAINERPQQQNPIRLGVRIGTEGTYTLKLKTFPEECKIILTDKLAGRKTDLSQEAYTFTALCGTDISRFEIELTAIGDVTGTEQITKETASAWVEGNHICIRTTEGTEVAIYSLSGMLLEKRTTLTKESRITMPAGTYIVVIPQCTTKVIVTEK